MFQCVLRSRFNIDNLDSLISEEEEGDLNFESLQVRLLSPLEEYLERLERKVEEKQRTEKVLYTDTLSPQQALDLYRMAYFPLPSEESGPMRWIKPVYRGVLFFARFHVPRSWRPILRRTDWHVTFDKAFAQVLQHCQKVHRQRSGHTWITDGILELFQALHQAGHAHSVEVWDAQGRLIGGLYGLEVDGVFCGESMFYLESGASKRALVSLVEYLKGRGATWMDTQMVTEVFKMVGAKYITNEIFMTFFRLAKRRGLKLFD
jgi:leucyl/phenylalanyl-tRNA--protein transferase